MYNVNENKEVIKPVLALSNPSSSNITVYVGDNSNTATGEQTQQHYYKQHVNNNNLIGGGVDYNSGPYDVIFPAKETSVTFDIPIINDNIVEGSEFFTLTVTQMSLPNRVICGHPCMATITVADTSGKTLIMIIIQSLDIKFLSFGKNIP